MRVPVRVLEAKLFRFLKDARAGREVVVTSRGRRVARLSPAPEEAGEEPGAEELLPGMKLVSGIRLGAGGEPLGAKRAIPIRPRQKTLAEIVLEDRG
jgi:prevent-host-death family protein